jgi:hypothetical protein
MGRGTLRPRFHQVVGIVPSKRSVANLFAILLAVPSRYLNLTFACWKGIEFGSRNCVGRRDDPDP